MLISSLLNVTFYYENQYNWNLILEKNRNLSLDNLLTNIEWLFLFGLVYHLNI